MPFAFRRRRRFAANQRDAPARPHARLRCFFHQGLRPNDPAGDGGRQGASLADRPGGEDQLSVRLREQVQATRCRRVEPAAVDEHGADGAGPQGEIGGPQTRRAAGRLDEEGARQQATIAAGGADQHVRVGRAAAADPGDPPRQRVGLHRSPGEVGEDAERGEPGQAAGGGAAPGPGR